MAVDGMLRFYLRAKKAICELLFCHVVHMLLQ